MHSNKKYAYVTALIMSNKYPSLKIKSHTSAIHEHSNLCNLSGPTLNLLDYF